jgi:hypothetical protein
MSKKTQKSKSKNSSNTSDDKEVIVEKETEDDDDDTVESNVQASANNPAREEAGDGEEAFLSICVDSSSVSFRWSPHTAPSLSLLPGPIIVMGSGLVKND